MNLKTQIEIYLKSTGMTTSQLSKLAGVPNATLSDWLSGRNPRNFDQVKRVADVFKITLDHLLYGNGLSTKDRVTEIDDLIGEGWLSGVFEVRLRRISKKAK